MKTFLNRPLEGDWTYLWIDATYLKVRRGGGIVSVAVIPAIGVNTDGRREVPCLETGTSEAEPIWTEFLRKLTRRGLRGVKLVISAAHEGIKPAVSKGLSATWQRCRRRRENSPPECFLILLRIQRNALAHAGKGGRRPGQKTTPRIAFWPGSISAIIATACAQGEADQRLIGGINRPPNAEADSTQWRAVADQIQEGAETRRPHGSSPASPARRGWGCRRGTRTG